MSVNEFLQWLLGSGGAIIASSWILERVKWFQNQASDVKEWVFFGLASVFSVGAYLVVTYVSPNILNMIAPYFLIVGGVFLTVIIGKKFHETDKANKA
jgi:hypothetical protein